MSISMPFPKPPTKMYVLLASSNSQRAQKKLRKVIDCWTRHGTAIQHRFLQEEPCGGFPQPYSGFLWTLKKHCTSHRGDGAHTLRMILAFSWNMPVALGREKHQCDYWVHVTKLPLNLSFPHWPETARMSHSYEHHARSLGFREQVCPLYLHT